MKEKKPLKNQYKKTLNAIIDCIEKSKLKAFAAVNGALLQAYWNIGEELSRTSLYGESVVEKLSQDLKLVYPNTEGYSTRNLWNMKKFYETYRKLQPAVADFIFKVSWSNHVVILDKTKTIEEKQFYLELCVNDNLSKRELIRQIDSSLFERYMVSNKPKKVLSLIPRHEISDVAKHFKDDYVLEFLNLGDSYSEKELEKSILDNLREFFLEFGKSFTFIGSQYFIDIGQRENRIDLLFFHRELNCLVAVDLKIGDFKAAYVGQMQKYLAALDDKVRLPNEKESIGLILCKSKNHEEVRFALAKTLSPMKVATYTMKLPDKEMIMKRLEQFNMYVKNKWR